MEKSIPWIYLSLNSFMNAILNRIHVFSGFLRRVVCWYATITLYGAATQKAMNPIFTAVKTSNLESMQFWFINIAAKYLNYVIFRRIY
jgi:hypothetical protein